MESVGERPVIFSQGIFPPAGGTATAGKRVPSLGTANKEESAQLAAEIRSFAEISRPSVLVEDTHPSDLVLPRGIRRVLIVRPTEFDYLLDLRRHYRSVYSSYLLSDAPGSPTWPYSEIETATVLGWPRWHVIGPVYRAARGDQEVAGIRERYRVTAGERMCVFSMGGGGGHGPRGHDIDSDAVRFAREATAVGRVIRESDPNSRLIFVQGPYFPADVHVDDCFEVVPQEPQMPALIAAADGAVIRTGFNTTWECLSAGTPFLPFLGTTYAEPTEQRLTGLRTLGLVPDNAQTFWSDARWRAGFRESCRSMTQALARSADGGVLSSLILDRPSTVSTARSQQSAADRGLAAERPSPRAATPKPPRNAGYVIRIDDILTLDPPVDWLLRVLAARGLKASLEVVPYLVDFEERALEIYDPTGDLFEVSQHGYSHIPRTAADGRRYEFDRDSHAATPEEDQLITSGKDRLERAFPARFTGGFSPPYDVLPCWLPSLWRDRGGSFVSRIDTSPFAGTPGIPVVQSGIDIWDWPRSRAHRRRHILQSIEQQLRTGGHAGIVLHPRCLWLRSQQRRLIALLDHLERRGFESRSLRQIATDPPAEHECLDNALSSSAFREGLRGLFSWMSGRS